MKFVKLLLIAVLTLGIVGCGDKKGKDAESTAPVTDLDIQKSE